VLDEATAACDAETGTSRHLYPTCTPIYLSSHLSSHLTSHLIPLLPIADAAIQKTIREQFVNKTVLTIAHRLDLVVHNDKILIMAAGKVVEFDCPEMLSNNTNSVSILLLLTSSHLYLIKQIFYSMLKNSHFNNK
jgi:hypothetical protein